MSDNNSGCNGNSGQKRPTADYRDSSHEDSGQLRRKSRFDDSAPRIVQGQEIGGNGGGGGGNGGGGGGGVDIFAAAAAATAQKLDPVRIAAIKVANMHILLTKPP